MIVRRLLLILSLAVPLVAADPPRLEDLRWMSGHWSATIDGRKMEEVWLAPESGVMPGLHRDVKGDRASFEFMRVAVTKDGIAFLAQPSGRPVTPFPLLEMSKERVVFANPEHDFPKRVIYWLKDGQLCARVEGDAADAEQAEEWCWARR
jgi:hypothetical protein